MFKKLNIFQSKLFSFHNNKISPKYGTPCCKYGQNNKPLKKELVTQIFKELENNLHNWNLENENSKLTRYFYIQEYYQVTHVINDILSIDRQNGQTKPSILVINGDLLKIELCSYDLNGLSTKDFELALKLNAIQWGEYRLLELKNERFYRREARTLINEIENKKIREELKSV